MRARTPAWGSCTRDAARPTGRASISALPSPPIPETRPRSPASDASEADPFLRRSRGPLSPLWYDFAHHGSHQVGDGRRGAGGEARRSGALGRPSLPLAEGRSGSGFRRGRTGADDVARRDAEDPDEGLPPGARFRRRPPVREVG